MDALDADAAGEGYFGESIGEVGDVLTQLWREWMARVVQSTARDRLDVVDGETEVLFQGHEILYPVIIVNTNSKGGVRWGHTRSADRGWIDGTATFPARHAT